MTPKQSSWGDAEGLKLAEHIAGKIKADLVAYILRESSYLCGKHARQRIMAKNFFNHKDAIHDTFGLEIKCDRRLGYYIGNSGGSATT